MNSVTEKKYYLKSYLELKEELELEAEKAGYWQQKARGLSSPNLNSYGIHSNNPFRPLDKYLELAEQCAKKGEELERKKHEIVSAINCLENPLYRRVLKLVYIEGKNFVETAENLHYTVKYIYNIHHVALVEFKIPENKSCEKL